MRSRIEGGQAREWRRSFAARAVTLSQADWLVAAAALSNGGRLAVEDWPTGV